LQGQEQKAEELAYEIHERFPDYLFGRTNLVTILAEKGEIEQARELIDPLFSRKRLHFAEFSAFCSAQIQLSLAEGNREAAESWLDMMKQVVPDDPNIPALGNEEMVKETSKAVRQNKADFTEVMQDYARRHPEITHLIPYLLERGDPGGRDFAVKLASAIKTPETLVMLHDFALSQQGSDKTRMEAAQAATEAGLLPSGLPARMWIKGEWLDVMMLGFEISFEPDEENRMPPRGERLAASAHEELKYGDPVKAEQLLKQAIEIAPDVPSLLNNLAAAYATQGKIDESHNLVAEVRRRFPDYFFGITNEA
jgi:tetratricopeptide (TPR) repeat protein